MSNMHVPLRIEDLNRLSLLIGLLERLETLLLHM
jgi:hypothetical protein